MFSENSPIPALLNAKITAHATDTQIILDTGNIYADLDAVSTIVIALDKLVRPLRPDALVTVDDHEIIPALLAARLRVPLNIATRGRLLDGTQTATFHTETESDLRELQGNLGRPLQLAFVDDLLDQGVTALTVFDAVKKLNSRSSDKINIGQNNNDLFKINDAFFIMLTLGKGGSDTLTGVGGRTYALSVYDAKNKQFGPGIIPTAHENVSPNAAAAEITNGGNKVTITGRFLPGIDAWRKRLRTLLLDPKP